MFPAMSINPSKTSSCTRAVSQTSADTPAFIRAALPQKNEMFGPPKEPVTQTRPRVYWEVQQQHQTGQGQQGGS